MFFPWYTLPFYAAQRFKRFRLQDQDFWSSNRRIWFLGSLLHQRLQMTTCWDTRSHVLISSSSADFRRVPEPWWWSSLLTNIILLSFTATVFLYRRLNWVSLKSNNRTETSLNDLFISSPSVFTSVTETLN